MHERSIQENGLARRHAVLIVRELGHWQRAIAGGAEGVLRRLGLLQSRPPARVWPTPSILLSDGGAFLSSLKVFSKRFIGR